MGIKLLRGTMGRTRRGVFSRELIDFETRFERVWPANEEIDPGSRDSQLKPRKSGMDVNNRDEPLKSEREPGAESPSIVQLNYPPV